MRRILSRSLLAAPFLFICALLLTAPSTARADDLAPLREISAGFVTKKFDQIEAAAKALAATGDPRVAPLLEGLRAGQLYYRKSDNVIALAEKAGKNLALFDPFTQEALGEVGKRKARKVKVNNNIRRLVDSLLGGLTLRAPDPAVRLSAAAAIFKARDVASEPALREALEAETDASVRTAFSLALAAIHIADASASETDRLAAVGALQEHGDRDALSLLGGLEEEAPVKVKQAAAKAQEAIEARLAAWGYVQNVWYGLSLGSVLLLAAIGLAITFGVMGVINMAHGELVMLGAYTTFAVQETIRTSAPHLFEASLFIAAPLAFLVAGGAGVAIERGVVRFLYGRPLETLLATWGVSLILQQTVRSIFGPNNREVGNPDWMSGAFEVGAMTVTYNRLWILIFALGVFALLLLLLKRTPLGLQMRAVTQNRAMAADMGVRTGWVDAMTFGLGAGVAGLAGVALSQIDNVSPNLGQSYIVDSFMVVVFGGAGNLWGALAGAFTLGVVNKFLEPVAGAV
ncbi:MAG: urea ABC transporter permease subunit UrtB, partial [Rhodobacteraceae bacterium]|nr:urea ABC transporter permease subunit UrtB [Paracoccaceae bacterium]